MSNQEESSTDPGQKHNITKLGEGRVGGYRYC